MQDDELWQAFLEEVREQLDHLESELVGANLDDVEITNQLFRYFHSIKSSSAMFEFTAMEEVAHAAENVLDQVRKGFSKGTDDIINVLLVTTDCLKEQLAEGEKSLQPPTARPDIMQALSLHIIDEVPDQGVSYDQDVNDLGIDPVEMEEFAELSEVALRKFFEAIEKDDNEAAIKSVNKLAKACIALDFTQLASELGQLVQLVSNDSVKDTAHSLEVCVKIIDQLNMLQELSGQYFSISSLHGYFDKLYRERYLSSISEFKTQLISCRQDLYDKKSVEEEKLDKLCETNDELVKFYKLFGLSSSRDLFRYFNQVCRKAILGHIDPDIEHFDMVAAIVVLHVDAVGNHDRQKDIDEECAAILSDFRGTLMKEGDQNFGRQERLAEITRILELDSDYLDYVDNSEIELIEYCIQAEKTTALIQVDLEADQEWSKQFVHWLDNSEIITSRTVFCMKKVKGKQIEYTKTSFLLVFDEDPATVRQSLENLQGSDEYIESLVFKIHKGMEHEIFDDTEAGRIKESEKIDAVSKTIRVNSDSIDRFVSQVGEMVLQRNMMSHAIHDKEVDVLLKRCRSILSSSQDGILSGESLEDLKETFNHINECFDDIVHANTSLTESVSFVQEEVMSLRVVPISIVFNRLPRIVRTINKEYDKDIRLEITGEQVRVDKSMVDVLMEPLVHLVRNCADHGIETAEQRKAAGKSSQALIKVSAEQSSNLLNIKISDNGMGLDYQKIRDKAIAAGIHNKSSDISDEDLKQLIFHPGFSTSDKVTETSGRGVGMDAVRNRLAAIGGSIEVDSTPGEGTIFNLKLPLSAAIQGVILFEHQGETLTIPERNVVLGLTVPISELQTVQGQAAFIHQGEILPLYSIGELLKWSTYDDENSQEGRRAKTEQEVIVITDGNYHIGLAVDKVVGRQEIFVRDLHTDLMSLPGIGGASILGNGEVVLILDSEAILKIASENSQNLETLLKVS